MTALKSSGKMEIHLVTMLLYGYQLLESLGASASISLARGKPSSQSYTLSGLGSNRAVDGVYNREGCAHTTNGDSSWWTVDLQDIFAIDKVKVYNRNTQKERLDNMFVEGFPIGDPHLCGDQMNLCGFNLGPSGDEVTVNCPNNTIARYIRLRGGPSMTMCEVDVFGQAPQTNGTVEGCRKWNMRIKPGTKLGNQFLSLGKAATRNGCMTLCWRHHNLCNIFSYNVVDGSCEIPVKPIRDSSLAYHANWNLYYTC